VRAVDLDSDSFLARWFLSGALHSAKRLDESMASGEMALAMSGRHPCVVGSLATIFADCGKPVDAEALYEELVARARRSYVQPSQLAIAASAADKKDEAIRHARIAFETRDAAIAQFGLGLPPGPDVFIHWPFNARLHKYLRFRELLSVSARTKIPKIAD
jgi:hypothetical protein